MRHGAELAHFYRQADVFVFPSRTDTFGLVLVEAMACGTPVAAFPVTGAVDVVRDPAAGVLGDDLRSAALSALGLDRDRVHGYAQRHSWTEATRQFVDNLHPRPRGAATPAGRRPLRGRAATGVRGLPTPPAPARAGAPSADGP